MPTMCQYVAPCAFLLFIAVLSEYSHMIMISLPGCRVNAQSNQQTANQCQLLAIFLPNPAMI